MKSLASTLILAAVIFNGCKKGPEDPLLSLRTRKSRICKQWILEKAEKNVIQSVRSGSFVTNSITSTWSTADSVKIKTTYYGETITKRYGSHHDFHFFKDGSYVSSRQIHKVSADTIPNGLNPKTFEEYKYAVIYDSTISEGYYGTWDFTGGKNDMAKNEMLLLSTNRQTTEITAKTIYTALDGGPGLTESIKISRTENRISGGSHEEWKIRGLHDGKICLERTLDESYSKWNGNTYPNAEKISGEERLELKEKK